MHALIEIGHFISDIATKLNQFSSLVTAVATAILAIITILLWLENRSLRKAGSKPEVIAYLAPHKNGTGAVCLVIANVGNGPAFDVSISIDCDRSDFRSHNVILGDYVSQVPITAIPQGEKISVLFGVGYVLFGKVNGEQINVLKPFILKLNYKTVLGKIEKRSFVLDISQFAGIPGIVEKSNETKSAEALIKIEKHLAQMTKNTAHLYPWVDATMLSDQIVQKLKGQESEMLDK